MVTLSYKPTIYNSLKSGLIALWPLIVLLIVNLVFFHRHYTGESIFPWDFYGGYHAMAYAFYADGGFFSPELWTPYGSYGYPTHLSLQNSSFYLPLAILDGLNITYTFQVAAIVQSLHILFGALGVFYFLRINGISIGIALVTAIFFQLSAGFFSNAQHVDIIRGYALTPWVFIVCSRFFLTDLKTATIAAWCGFQFLAGAYLGVIIAVIYGLMLFIIWECYQKHRPQKLLTYLSLLSLTGLIAVLLSLIKFLPSFALLDEIETVRSTITSAGWSHFLTALFRFDLDHVPYDLTMRSYYLPAIAIVTLIFARPTQGIGLFGLLLLALGVAFVSNDLPFREWLLHLPGLELSRFHISDFRILVHFGLLIFIGANLAELSQHPLNQTQMLNRGFLSVLVLFILIVLVTGRGYYNLDTLYKEIVALLMSLFVAFIIIPKLARPGFNRNVALVSLALLAILSAKTYYKHKNTWDFSDYYSILSERVFKQKLVNFINDSERQSSWKQRPERFFELNKVASNLGYYNQSFGEKGYDIGIRLSKNLALRKELDTLDKKERSPLSQFMANSSQLIITNQVDEKSILNQIKLCNTTSACNTIENSYVQLEEFSISKARYQVNIKDSQWLIENELYFPGWDSKICEDTICRDGPAAGESLGMLRTYKLPAGRYELQIYYTPPLWGTSQIAFWIGFFISILALLIHFTPNTKWAKMIKFNTTR